MYRIRYRLKRLFADLILYITLSLTGLRECHFTCHKTEIRTSSSWSSRQHCCFPAATCCCCRYWILLVGLSYLELVVQWLMARYPLEADTWILNGRVTQQVARTAWRRKRWLWRLEKRRDETPHPHGICGSVSAMFAYELIMIMTRLAKNKKYTRWKEKTFSASEKFAPKFRSTKDYLDKLCKIWAVMQINDMWMHFAVNFYYKWRRILQLNGGIGLWDCYSEGFEMQT